MVKRCEACQFHAKQIHQPVQELQSIPLTWPFAVWGLDILGPFPRAQGGYRYLYVAIDKFTKWVEVEPVCTIPARSAVKFIRGLVNSRSHNQCVVNPHIRVDTRITSSITIPNNILTIGHMTKFDIATQGKFTTKQRIPNSVDDPRHAYYPTGN
jgi:hypothetical protein